MTRTRILVACIAVVGLVAVVSGFSTPAEDIQTHPLRVLFEDNGQFTEWSFDLSTDDLGAYFSDGVVQELLAGERLHISSGDDLEGVLDLVDVAEGQGLPNIFILYADVIPSTWTCVKCCYSSPPSSCCCKPKEPDEIADGNTTP